MSEELELCNGIELICMLGGIWCGPSDGRWEKLGTLRITISIGVDVVKGRVYVLYTVVGGGGFREELGLREGGLE